MTTPPEQLSAGTADELALVLVNAERERYSLPPLLLSALPDKNYDLVKRYAQTVLSAGYRLVPNEPQAPSTPADDLVSQIEQRFPNWRSHRDLLDCIDCTLHDLRKEAP